jgi:hypothetical protein
MEDPKMERPEREVLMSCDQVVAKLRGLMSENRAQVRLRFQQQLYAGAEGETLVAFIRDLIHPDTAYARREAAHRILNDKSPGSFHSHLRNAVMHADRANRDRLSLSFPELVSGDTADV